MASDFGVIEIVRKEEHCMEWTTSPLALSLATKLLWDVGEEVKRGGRRRG